MQIRSPLEVLLLIFKAVHKGSSATIMHIRKWLLILINRSLVRPAYAALLVCVL